MIKFIKIRIELLNDYNKVLYNQNKNFICLFNLNIVLLILVYLNPLFYKFFINKVIIEKNLDSFFYIVFGYIATFFLKMLFEYFKLKFTNRFVNISYHRLKLTILSNLFKSPISEGSLHISDFKLTIEDDLDFFKIFLENQTVEYIIVLLKIITSTVLLYKTNIVLSIFAVSIIPITKIIEYRIGQKKEQCEDLIRSNKKDINEFLKDSISNWKIIKAHNLQKMEIDEYKKHLYTYSEINRKWMNLWTLTNRIIPRVKDEFFMKISVYFIGGLLLSLNKITIGSLLVFISYFELLSSSINEVFQKNEQLMESLPHLKRIQNELNNTNKTSQKHKFTASNKCLLELINISYKYDESDEIIRNLSIQLESGDSVAIIGRSGIGKSTLAKLLLRIIHPNKGKILLNGISIEKIDYLDFYNTIGIVDSDSRLFNDSILNNLQIDSKYPLEKLERICDGVDILEDIKKFPQGFDTVIGEGGIKLSNGQRQRLLIAQQIIRNPKILVLDEATSAMDINTEKKVFSFINELSEIEIKIIITHSSGPLKICNKIIRIDKNGVALV